ncbi:hypothetical protein NZK35_10665 [Stieleria sp. ICT_E10.1]|nr:hypothetical protein [Stieleria sedimenti]MCS7467103.1 hypothetical protein [Stieleria sedimenti]
MAYVNDEGNIIGIRGYKEDLDMNSGRRPFARKLRLQAGLIA